MSRKDNIYKYFPKRIFILGFALFIIVTVLIIFIDYYNLKKGIILEAENHAKIIAEHLSYELFKVYGMDITDLDWQAGEDFNNHFLTQAKPLGVDSIKIYNKEGKIVFSNDPQLVGKKVPDNKNFQKALQNELVSNIASAEYYRRMYNIEIDRDMVETYIPIYNDSRESVVGVFEIYQDYTPLLASIRSAIERTAVIILVLMISFSLVLFVLVRRGNVILATEKERLVEELENTVDVRTRELRESEKKYKTFLDNATDSVLVLDNNMNFVLVNHKLLEITGYSYDEISSKKLMDILDKSETNVKTVDENLKSALRGDNVSFELNIKDKENGIIPLEITAKKIIYNNQEMIMGVGRDVSERRKMEEIRNDFYSMLTHDFRVPLTPILGFASILLEEKWGKLTEKSKNMVETISRNATRLNDLIDTYLLSAKIDSNSLVLIKSEFEMNRFIEEVLLNHEPSIETNKLKLIKELTSDELYVIGDISQMERVLSNLLTNAIKYNKIGGIVKVKTSMVDNGDNGGKAMVEIFNSYGVVSEMELSDIFEKYRRSEKTGRISGTGLGLYIVRSIIKLHGGEIDVKSKEGLGTTFSFTIPLKG